MVDFNGFKAQIKRDIKKVFHNAEEHADITEVEYNGKKRNIPVVIDYNGNIARKETKDDHAEGIFISDMTVYISFYDLKIVPRKGTLISIDGDEYTIVKAGYEAGEIALDLELFDE